MPSLILTGTHGNSWQTFAESLSTQSIKTPLSGSFEKDVIYCLSDPSADLTENLAKNGAMHAVVFCEAPAHVIASEAEKSKEGQAVETALQHWSKSAEIILSQWRKNRTRFHLLNWDECQAYPEEFSQWVHTLSGISALNDHYPVLDRKKTSLALRVVAEEIVRKDRTAARLWSEIEAACQPIAKGVAMEDLRPDAFQALAELIQFKSADKDRLEQELASVRTELESQKESALKTHEMLLQELQNAFKESEDFFEQLETSQNEYEQAKQSMSDFATQLEQSKGEVIRLTALHQEAEQARNIVFQEKSDFEQELETTRTELESQKESALKTHEMLLQELQNAFKESEDFFEQWKSHEAATIPGHLIVGPCIRGTEHLQPPHCHHDFTFESVTLFERHWRRLPVRLVEHNGNAGLAIFNPFGNGSDPLYRWEPQGQEGGIDFMLFVPADKASRDRLVAAPASDLLLIRELTARILGHLSVHGETGTERWIPVARRLLQQIDEIPERLHYDDVKTSSSGTRQDTSIRFTLSNLYFRGVCARSYAISWKPGSQGGSLTLEQPDFDHTILASSVGIGSDGAVTSLAISFDSAEETQKASAAWRRLTRRDQDFIRVLVRELPNLIYHLCEQNTDLRPRKRTLIRKARTLSGILRGTKFPHNIRTFLTQLIS
jgi:chemotaxis protein histidine kinase CheA